MAEGGEKRKVCKGRFGGGSSSARGISPDPLLELLRGTSEEDQNTFKRNMGTHGGSDVSSVEGDNPQIGVRVEDPAETPCLESFKSGKKFLRTGFFVGSGEKKDGIFTTDFNLLFPKRLVSRCGETNLHVPQDCCSPGRCWPVAREDSSDRDEYGAPAGGDASERGENDADGLVHDLPNSLVDGATSNVLGDMDIVGGCCTTWGECFRGHPLQFENSVYARPAESICMNRFAGVNSLHSVTCHPSMHAPSLARVFGGESGRVSGMDCREGVGAGSRGRDIARLDALVHDVIHFVPASGNPRI